MESGKPTADLLAYLDLRLETDLEGGLAAWHQAFLQARDAWRMRLAGQLLHRLKRYPLTDAQRATVYVLEAQWLTQQARWLEAAAAFERSLGLAPGRLPALSGLGTVLQHLPERGAQAVARLQEALTLADSDSRSGILNNLGLAYYKTGQLAEAEAALEEARATFQAEGDRPNEASALHNLGSVAWTRGQLGEAQEYFQSASALWRELARRHDEAETLNSLGLVLEASGQWDGAAETYRRALSLLQLDGDEYGQAQVLANLGNVLTLSGDLEHAAACLENGLLVARSLGEAQLEGQLLTGLAELRQAQGRSEEALRLFQQSLERKRVGGDTRSLKHTWLSLGAFYHKLRQPAEAQSAYTEALATARAQGDRRIETHALINLAKLALVQGQPDEAARHVEAAVPLAEAGDFQDALSDIAQLCGDLELLRPDPDYGRLLLHYTEALIHAHNFNAVTLRRMLDYLIALMRALADDGQPAVAAQMAADLASLAARADLPAVVSEAFSRLEFTP